MKDSTPDCPPFTRRQLDRFAELKAEIDKRDALSALDPKIPKINERIDELSVKVLRFGLRNIHKESRRPGEFIREVPTYGGRLLPGEHRRTISMSKTIGRSAAAEAPVSRDYTPPANLEAEQSVLGAILVTPEKLDQVVSIITPKAFYREDHRRIYQAMVDLYGRANPWTW